MFYDGIKLIWMISWVGVWLQNKDNPIQRKQESFERKIQTLKHKMQNPFETLSKMQIEDK